MIYFSSVLLDIPVVVLQITYPHPTSLQIRERIGNLRMNS